MERFDKLEVTQLRSTSSGILVRRRGTGKTVLLKNLVHHMFASNFSGGEDIHMAVLYILAHQEDAARRHFAMLRKGMAVAVRPDGLRSSTSRFWTQVTIGGA